MYFKKAKANELCVNISWLFLLCMRSWGECSPFLPFLSELGGHCAEDCLDPPWTVHTNRHISQNFTVTCLCVYTLTTTRNNNHKTWILTFLISHATRTGCHWPVPRSRFLQKYRQRWENWSDHHNCVHVIFNRGIGRLYHFCNFEIGRSPWAPSWDDLMLEQILRLHPTQKSKQVTAQDKTNNKACMYDD